MLEAVVAEPGTLARLVEERFLIGVEEDRAGVELDFSAVSTELNHRFFFGLDGVVGAAAFLLLLLLSLLPSLSLLSLLLPLSLFSVGAALFVFSSSDLGVTSTSSASRYHLRRRV